ncbi:50S ribosomal protein L4 [Candidatus Gottesmanbacteria bacterium]|nr:50S ribosomal protein L4 [Candidatus Gottesmanbacteria bacterium]
MGILRKNQAYRRRAARNISSVDIIGAKDLHPYAVVTHKKIVFTKAAMEESKTHFTK